MTMNIKSHLMLLAVLAVALIFGHLGSVSATGVTSTLNGFVLATAEDCEENCTDTIEVTDGDETVVISLPTSFLPDNIKEGDPLKIELSVDETMRVEANKRMEIRKAKRERAEKRGSQQ